MSWSGGKDSVMTLHYLLSYECLGVVCLLTTLTEQYDRVTMHGVRREVIKMQAASIGLPLLEVFIPSSSSNQLYEEKMKEALNDLRRINVDAIAFGDIFLEDVRRYREEKMSGTGMKLLFPLWGRSSKMLVEEFLMLGYKAVICSIDALQLSPSYLGEELTLDLLSRLPSNMDPGGENGEYHTFVYDGPLFRHPVRFRLGDRVVRENRFHYIDILPETG